MSELNCYCGSKRDGCAVLKEANDIICIEKQTDSINAVFFGTQTLAETKAAKSCVVRYMLSVSYQENVYFTHSLKVTFGADRSNVCHSKHEGTSCIMQNEPLCPFGASQSSSAVRIEVNLTRIEVTLRKIPRCGVFPHLYQHFFLNSIYKGQCVVHHDFEFDSSVKLIHGLNMEFSNNMSPVEIYGSEKDVQLIDVLINRNATKCLGEHREREIMAASERKAWTIVIFKCTARLESAPCDTTMMRTLNRRKLSDDVSMSVYICGVRKIIQK
uniref:Ras-GAP domain-containing protein n=1 Tax=Parascaris univalens TaxID=6257 RepID=A0A914ZX31_PARUN